MKNKIPLILLIILIISFIVIYIIMWRRKYMEEIVLSNKYISIIVEKKFNPFNDKEANLIIKEIKNLKTGYSWKLENSLIWQVGLGKIGEMPKKYPTLMHAVQGIFFDANRLELVKDRDMIILRWKNIDLPNSSQTLDVTVVITLTSSGKVEWNIDVSISPGEKIVYYVNFPYLLFKKIGESGEDDYLVFPEREGRLIRNPISVGNKIPDDTTNLLSRAFFYPGEITTQLMAYYDKKSGEGFYIAAEDKYGNVKRIYFNSIRNYLYLYFTHFNFAYPDSRKNIIDQLQHFSLKGKLNYTMATQLFKGDWIDATLIYRKWVEKEKPIFISKGKLKFRNDISDKVKLVCFGILYRIRRPINKSATYDEDDPNSDFSRIRKMIEFFIKNNSNIVVAVNIVGLEEFPGLEIEDLALGGDWGKGVMRNGSAELLDTLVRKFGAITAFNHDTGHWIIKCREDLRNVINCSEIEKNAYPKAIIKMEDFNPPPWPSFKGKMTLSCLGSKYIFKRIIKSAEDTMEKSRKLANGDIGFGFTVAMLTGQGSVCYPCYAPLDDKTDLSLHNHPIGGGNWYIMQWRKIVEALYNEYRAKCPDFVIMAEREHEHLIDNAITLGKNNIYPFDSLGNLGHRGDVVLSSNAQPIPLMVFIYHDYRLQIEAPSIYLHFLEIYRKYISNPIQLYYHITVSYIVWGRIPSIGLTNIDNPSLKKFKDVLGTPSERSPVWRELLEYVRKIVEARYRGREYLIFGQALRPPKASCIKVKIPLRGIDKYQEYDLPAVIVSAWKSQDGKVGIVLANYIDKDTDVKLDINVEDYGLNKTSYNVYLLTDNGRKKLKTFLTSTFTLNIAVPKKTIIILEID